MNMQAIGKKITALRKERDMTQVELADKIGVTYQAVSSWERGNSMPDIAKLPDISQVLGVSIDDLLDNAKATELVKNVLTGQDTSLHMPDMETLADVAPILKPSQVVKAVEQANKDSDNIFADMDAFVEIASYLSSDALFEIVKTQMDAGNCHISGSILVKLADHFDSDDLKELALNCNISGSELAQLADHMDSEDIKKLALQCTLSKSELIKLADHLDSEDLQEIIQNYELDDATVSKLAYHMDSEDLVGVATRMIKNHGIKILTNSGIIEHMDEDDIAEAINAAMKP